MSLRFKYIPLTFLKNEKQIKEQIKNTVILSYFHSLNPGTIKLNKLIEGTQYGYNASAKESGNNHFLRISDITDGNVNWSTVPYCNCESEASYILKKGDLLIARTGGTTGKSFLIKNPPEKAIYAGYLIRIRANENSNPDFLNLFLNSYAYWSQVVSLNRGEFRPSVNASKLKNLLLPNCDIQQQADAVSISKGKIPKGYQILEQKIQRTLNEYENCIKLQKKIISQGQDIQLLKQSILQEAIQGKLTEDWQKQNPDLIYGENSAEKLLLEIKAEKAQLIKEKKIRKEKPIPPISDDEIPFELPQGWVWCRLGEVYRSTSGGTPSRSNRKFWNGNITWYKSGELNDSYLLQDSKEKITETGLEMSSATLFPQGTLLIAMYGATAGKISILEKEATTNQAVCGFFQNNRISTLYLFYYLKANRKKMISESWGMSQPNISQTYLRNFCVALPSFNEQKEIVRNIENLLKESKVIQNEIEKSEEYAEGLIKAVLKEAFENITTKKEVLEI